MSHEVRVNVCLVLQVVTKSVAHHFAASSEAEMLDWITAFQTVAFKDNVSRQTIEEDNDLYCSSGDGMYQS
ncbi:hypothetical protein LSTR_LSTR014780 [Laodelphax striatellus]|uniref:PH domain-containing protein n=1 Tax=Laodelphax striatellus TaxID=195883 RepID=A0A482WKL9_LAOST|nr:hypothetical protein LSTR_LSTR014780 [Laodelphax striatellus]